MPRIHQAMLFEPRAGPHLRLSTKALLVREGALDCPGGHAGDADGGA